MWKKITIPALIAILVALFSGTIAFAAQDGPRDPEMDRQRPRRHAAVGEILAVDLEASQFEFRTRAGDELALQVLESTRFRGQASGLEDLQPGMTALVAGRRNEEGDLLAVVVAVPDPDRQHQAGIVVSVDLESQQFELETRDAENLNYAVSEATRFAGQAGGLDELTVGMRAVVAADPGSDALQAAWVATPLRLQRRRFLGRVTAVDPQSDQFSVQTPGGEQLTITTNAETRFRSRDDQLGGLEDLQVGMLAGGIGTIQGEHTILAKAVIAGSPQLDLKTRGTITSVGDAGFSLTDPQGEVIEIGVDENTRFRSPGGEVQGLADLEAGMASLVGAQERPEGGYLARIVLVRPAGTR